MKVRKCKGMKDMSPSEMTAFRLVEGICRDCCSRWGFQEVRTPTIEYLHLFTSAGTLTPGRLGRVYSFLDWDGWSGERVVLRPDGTIPVARLYTETYDTGEPARLFYSTNIFIFEDTGEESRERWQCGAELIGAGSSLADTELVLLSLEMLQKLGLKDIELRLSHAGLIKVLLEKLGLSRDEKDRLFDRILDGDTDTLSQINREIPGVESALLPMLSLKGQSSGFLKNQRAVLLQDIPEIGPHLDDFLQMTAILEELGCKYRIDIASGASFEYYTGMIFQMYIGGEKIGGGGRYDALIPSMGGGQVPASGVALYLDRLMDMVEYESIMPPSPSRIMVRAAGSSVADIKNAFETADTLRNAGYITEAGVKGRVSSGNRWIVDINSQLKSLTVTDTDDDKRVEVAGINDLLKLLEGKRADKNSPA
jgi:histidyl-tRNA synthetase